MTRDDQTGQQTIAPEDEAVDQEPAPPEEDGGGSEPSDPHDAVGAYLLDALPEDERRAFEAHLAECPGCQAEVRALAPVVQLLPQMLDMEAREPDGIAGNAEAVPELQLSAGLRERILSAVQGEQLPERAELGAPVTEIDPDPPMSIEAIAPTSDSAPARPLGRVRPGVVGSRETAADAGFWRSVTRLERGWLAAAVLAIIAIGAIIWALGLQGQVDDLNGEISAQNNEIAQLRGSANATAAVLGPTSDGPAKANGTLYYSLQANQPPVLALQGMTPLSNTQVYQLWYIKGDAAPVPGPTFQVNDSGATTVPVATDIPTFTSVAITAEPDGGSKTPTTPVLMTGQLSGARG